MFDTGAGRVTHRPALHAEIDTVLGTLTGDELVARRSAARVGYARRREVGEVLEHPQLGGRWTVVGSPAGPLRALPPPIGFPGRPPRMDPVPALGEHTAAILRWLDGTDG